ncbi:MAG: alginate lyase family protein [Melioribacteraceae bacterium]|nr:alginate lyase family protein [Melioribacteraceae bacterium]
MNKYAAILILFFTIVSACDDNSRFELESFERDRVIALAEKFLLEEPVTITDFKCERSSGGIHDYYSEGDYWWPDPANPAGPYIRKDGLTNPENFVEHRKALRRFSIHVSALAAAYKITGDTKYADHALKHLNAWFVDKRTLMNPELLYAQAIFGRVKGRGIGIIDTIHLVEVAQAVIVLKNSGYLHDGVSNELTLWFQNYLNWLTTHEFGIDERDNGNNHSTCWAMQVAIYAKLIGDEETLDYCRNMFKGTLLPDQMEIDGSFPLELKRTKPYGYSLFNLDAMFMVAKILNSEKENLFEYRTSDGKHIKQAIEFMYPFIRDKSEWNHKKDVMYYDNWPVRHPSLLIAGFAYNESKYIDLWKKLEADPDEEEVIRNFPIRQPVLWF